MLQGRVKAGLSDFARFGTNTTVGVLGLMDVATDWNMPRHGESFSETLGYGRQARQMLDVGRLIDDVSLDQYLFVRDAYIQRRAQRERDQEGDQAGATAESR